MALPNKPLGELKAVRDPEVVEREVDILIVGGGMAACGAAFEVKKWLRRGQTVLLCDKAAMERSGAVAQGLSAINTYVGENSPGRLCPHGPQRPDGSRPRRPDLRSGLSCGRLRASVRRMGPADLEKERRKAKTWTVKKARPWAP